MKDLGDVVRFHVPRGSTGTAACSTRGILPGTVSTPRCTTPFPIIPPFTSFSCHNHIYTLFKMAASLSIKELLAKVTDLTNEFTTSLESNGQKEATFAADSPEGYNDLDPTIYVKRQVLTDLLQDLIWLIQGPTESITTLAHTVRCATAELTKAPKLTTRRASPTVPLSMSLLTSTFLKPSRWTVMLHTRKSERPSSCPRK